MGRVRNGVCTALILIEESTEHVIKLVIHLGNKGLSGVTDLPVSFEVFADEFYEMEKQARKIATWGDNVNVKIPVTNTKR